MMNGAAPECILTVRDRLLPSGRIVSAVISYCNLTTFRGVGVMPEVYSPWAWGIVSAFAMTEKFVLLI
jgi:hypothetical protein